MKRPKCRHPKAARGEGPRYPASYGSWATEVCGRCGSWRVEVHVINGRKRWHHEKMDLTPHEWH